ncbi:MAG: EcsC family protein [Pseudomonadota bacterium]
MAETLSTVMGAKLAPQMDEIVARYCQANSGLMRGITALGSRLERLGGGMGAEGRKALEAVTRRSLRSAYRVTAASDTGRVDRPRRWRESDRLHASMALTTGAVGGFFGPGASLAELPVSITTILRAIRSVARDYGYDPDDPETARDCLLVFTSGSPEPGDDGVDSAFLSARLTLTGSSTDFLIRTVSKKLSVMLGTRLGAQAVPVLGALSGAAVNYSFVRFYIEMAHVFFALRRLGEDSDPEDVIRDFRSAVARAEGRH